MPKDRITDSLTRPFWYREPANNVSLTVNSQGSDGLAFVAIPERPDDGPHVQYGVVLPPDVAHTLALRMLATLGNGAPRVTSEAEREPMYAAYRAAHMEAARIGETLSDDRIVQAAVKAYETSELQNVRADREGMRQQLEQTTAALRDEVAMVAAQRDEYRADLRRTRTQRDEIRILARLRLEAFDTAEQETKSARAELAEAQANGRQYAQDTEDHITRLDTQLEQAKAEVLRAMTNAETYANLAEAKNTRIGALDARLEQAEDYAREQAEEHSRTLAQAEHDAQSARAEIQRLGDLAQRRLEARDRAESGATQLRRRIAILTSIRPTEVEYGAARSAIVDAWPNLAGDAFVDQVTITALDAAWKVYRAPRAEDEPVPSGGTPGCSSARRVDELAEQLARMNSVLLALVKAPRS